MKKDELIKRWRKSGWGRLYWKSSNKRWYRTFESDDVCIIRDGASTFHLKSIEALEEMCKYAEAVLARD